MLVTSDNYAPYVYNNLQTFPEKYDTLNLCCFHIGPALRTTDQHQTKMGRLLLSVALPTEGSIHDDTSSDPNGWWWWRDLWHYGDVGPDMITGVNIGSHANTRQNSQITVQLTMSLYIYFPSATCIAFDLQQQKRTNTTSQNYVKPTWFVTVFTHYLWNMTIIIWYIFTSGLAYKIKNEYISFPLIVIPALNRPTI